MAEPVIPFAEGSPPDDLRVETLPDGDVLIGDPVLDATEESDSNFDANLAEDIDEKQSSRKAGILTGYFENDESARSEWKERYKQGLLTLDPEGGMDENEEERAIRGLSTVVHPLIAEAATQFNAKAIAELYPAGGPVKTTIIGEPNEETEDQARRVKEFMNYQIMEQMPEYFPDLDQMLFHLPLVGQTFKKVWWDANLSRQCSQFVKAEDFVVAPESKDLHTSPRYTHIIKMPKNDYNRYVAAGWYLPSEYTGDSYDEDDGYTTQRIEGIDKSDDSDDDVMTLLEMHCYEAFEGIDGIEDEESENLVMLPYVITIDYDSEKIVAIRRNWDEEDEDKKRRDWFVSYKFLPGLGFYGFGLYHMIGGLGRAATGSLRALLDSAAFANMQGGFKLKGRVSGGEIDVNPGEFVDLDATVDDVNKAIMPLPFKEPSQSLFNLLGFIVQAGQRFASTSDLNVGDVNPNAPVGSTVALIEQGSKAFSAIHKRLHYSQGQEFKLLAKLNAEHLEGSFQFSVAGSSETVFATDFDDRVDIIPVSDPNIFSTAQRIAQAQAILQMAQSAPQLHDLYEAYKRMYEAIRIPNIDEILIKPEEAPRTDPIDENMSIMYGKPIKAFPEQDHEAHIAVHIQFMQDPSLAGNPAAQTMQPILIAHIAEHVALLYRQRMEASINMPLPPLPNLRDPKFALKDIDPEMDMLISQRAAQVVAAAPQMQPIKALQAAGQQGQENPLEYAKQLAQLEAQALQQRTQSEIAADQAKARSDIEIDQAKARQNMDIQAAKVQAELEAKVQKLQAELQLEREKNAAKIQMEAMKSGL
ncbi:MAG: hypothetical protein CBB70_15620 [Planctomycetaceae bacterium TMED10]|nr:MAG: hypothetical protein CBB70_15620 [Planctomycetaceae bacterium TMED10]